LWSLDDWARSITALVTEDPLNARTILVPSESFAHALRVLLVVRSPASLNGTRLITPLAAATEVLRASGLDFKTGEARLRPLRLQRLKAYSVGDLNSRGWAHEFSFAVKDLESAALQPDVLVGGPAIQDLCEIWRGLDNDAGPSFTSARILSEAAALLSEQPLIWPFDGPTFAVGHVGTSAAEARFLLACPSLEVGIAAGRPLRRHAVERMTALFGTNAVHALATSTPAAQSLETEISLLQHYLFEAPDRLADPSRTRSRGPDGTVSLEAHAAVSDEIDAVVTWILQEIVEHGTSAQDLAVLSPDSEPWRTLIAERLGEVPNAPPVYFERGQPAIATIAGLRIAATLRAVAEFLPADAVMALLPRLRLQGSTDHLSPGRARKLIAQLATSGGSRARPSDALTWAEQIAVEAQTQLEARAVLPSIEALVTLASVVISNASLEEVWKKVRSFAESHLIAGQELRTLFDDLETHVVELCRVATHVTGTAAVELILDCLQQHRIHDVRFGSPAVYVGTIAGSAGLPFEAVRIVGLAEGAFPRARRGRVALPDTVCRELSPLIPTSDTAVVSDLHAFDAVVRGTRKRLSLSYSRRDVEGSEREPSALFIEIGSALARPNALTGAPSQVVPSLADIERDAFSVSRITAQRTRLDAPRTEHAWLLRTANGLQDVPKHWLEMPLTRPLPADTWPNLVDGFIGSEPLTTAIPGLDTPISASGLKSLLSCPHRFLQERVLHYRAHDSEPTRFRIAPAVYGTLLHRVAEVFFTAHGSAFGNRESTLALWMERAADVAQQQFDELLRHYPLSSETARSVERVRVMRDTKTLIELEWGDGTPRNFVGVEREFGTLSPLQLSTDAGTLLVRGRIDRLDTRSDVTIVRDLKTGRAKPRTRDAIEPDPEVDLQLALYAEVAKASAVEWQLPAKIEATYVHVDHLALEKERSFGQDIGVLETAGRVWLSLSTRILRERAFVRTADPDTCRGCAFAPVCGPRAAEKSAEQLANASGTLADFRDLK
jgi:RecB family exonuclease